jgi:hypothetical protein
MTTVEGTFRNAASRGAIGQCVFGSQKIGVKIAFIDMYGYSRKRYS